MSVCDTQDKFNKAVQEAIDVYVKSKKNNTIMIISFVFMLLFAVWGTLLALKVSDKQHRAIHIVLAVLTGPIYVVSYYLSMVQQ